jgi:peptidoglycan/LPS O-acetylase OafA/YrhL
MAGRAGYPDLLTGLDDRNPAFLAFYACATVVVAAVSWHFFEAPINRLKDRFEYR